METPEKVKKGLECCANDAYCCDEECPYFNPSSNGVDCASKMHTDSLTYTKQLEVQNAELLQKVQQLERERDAAVKDLQAISVLTFTACLACKHSRGNGKNCPRSVETVRCFEWRGVCEQNEGADHA